MRGEGVNLYEGCAHTGQESTSMKLGGSMANNDVARSFCSGEEERREGADKREESSSPESWVRRDDDWLVWGERLDQGWGQAA